MLFPLVGDAKRMMWSKWSATLLVWRDVNINAFHLIDKIFENLNSISNIFQEHHNFLIFTDSFIIYISWRRSQPKFSVKNTEKRFLDQGNAHALINSSKLLKWDLVYLLNTLGDPSLRIFAAGKASFVVNKSKATIFIGFY